MHKFLIRFKTAETTAEFRRVFEAAQKSFVPGSSSAAATPASTTEQVAPAVPAKDEKKSLSSGVSFGKKDDAAAKPASASAAAPGKDEKKPFFSGLSFGKKDDAAAKPASASAAAPGKDEKKPVFSGLSFGKKDDAAAKPASASAAAPGKDEKKPLFSGFSFGKKDDAADKVASNDAGANIGVKGVTKLGLGKLSNLSKKESSTSGPVVPGSSTFSFPSLSGSSSTDEVRGAALPKSKVVTATGTVASPIAGRKILSARKNRAKSSAPKTAAQNFNFANPTMASVAKEDEAGDSGSGWDTASNDESSTSEESED
eukprot:UC1_evm1s423